MKMIIWVLVLAMAGTIAFLKLKNESLRKDLILADKEKIEAVSLAKNEIWDKQQIIEVLHDSIQNSKIESIHRIDSIAKAKGWKISRLESDLALKSQWIDSVKQMANIGQFTPLNPKDTNKINPLGSIPVSLDVNCWGMKGEIITRDPNSTFNVLVKSTTNYTDLFVFKGKKFLWWTIRKPSYQIVNECGEVKITNIKIK
jgi:hypothetical protein